MCFGGGGNSTPPPEPTPPPPPPSKMDEAAAGRAAAVEKIREGRRSGYDSTVGASGPGGVTTPAPVTKQLLGA